MILDVFPTCVTFVYWCTDNVAILILFQVRKIRLEKRINEVVNRLNKTKKESQPNLRQDREERDKQERNEAKKEMKEKQQKEKDELERRKKEQELK